MEQLNARRESERAVTPGQLFGLLLVHELLWEALERYRGINDPDFSSRALDWLGERLGAQRLSTTLLAFVEHFPPPAVLRGELSPQRYLAASRDGRANAERVLEGLIILALANANPAFEPFQDLFDDRPLRRDTAYEEVLEVLEGFAATRPSYGLQGLLDAVETPASEAVEGTAEPLFEDVPKRHLFDALRAASDAAPSSLSGQLEFLRHAASHHLGPRLGRVLRGTDLLREEERPSFPVGPGPVELPQYEEEDAQAPERFTADRSWMPGVVLLAKNTHVWLDQLSRHHGRRIRHLDEIPGSALDELAARGIRGLWLIGVWERSPASREIKHRCGNPDADASAYSIYDYAIAEDLGGEAALEALREKAEERGIRLGSDMVPNHMGIDSRWVQEHPERFLRLPRPPFPSYTFEGPDLSSSPDVEIHLEDHYYNRSDAAVVFRRRDAAGGQVDYIYHGNDGTSTPWNDTAQLDFLHAETRKAVSDLILEVAGRFPILRFDAAMTLARRHVQRLWYPPPGAGGAVPSRSLHGLEAEDFDRLLPEEFWRQVVDRVAEEAPDTLLMAEAFWLMETYFVRTLGMHRVYNSAFMHCLRDERNGSYRKSLRETLAFSPGILERFVNFLNNPDERTAVEQFGKGEKYLGACTLMVTLPGLPLFGHGQIEGFVEKYGMEYRRAYLDETPDENLLALHERHIFPLLRRRSLFARAARFRFFDLVTPGGAIDDDVYAFCNRDYDEAALVLFNNSPRPARGRIQLSAPFVETEEIPALEEPSMGGAEEATEPTARFEPGDGEAKPEAARRLRREDLATALAPGATGEDSLLAEELGTGVERRLEMRSLRLRGLEVALEPYGCRVLWKIRVEAPDPSPALSRGHLAPVLFERNRLAEALAALPLSPAWSTALGEEILALFPSQPRARQADEPSVERLRRDAKESDHSRLARRLTRRIVTAVEGARQAAGLAFLITGLTPVEPSAFGGRGDPGEGRALGPRKARAFSIVAVLADLLEREASPDETASQGPQPDLGGLLGDIGLTDAQAEAAAAVLRWRSSRVSGKEDEGWREFLSSRGDLKDARLLISLLFWLETAAELEATTLPALRDALLEVEERLEAVTV